MKLCALRSFIHEGKFLHAGDEFSAPEYQADSLRQAGYAEIMRLPHIEMAIKRRHENTLAR
jgi:hypothetical protein